jgi:hypothetical protein
MKIAFKIFIPIRRMSLTFDSFGFGIIALGSLTFARAACTTLSA